MVFSDTTNKNGLIQYCEQLTGLGDAGISGDSTLLKQFTVLLNNAGHKITTMFFSYQDEWDFDDANNTDYPIATTNLIANQQDYNFPLSLGILQIKRVEVTFDGVNWYKAEPFDINERGLATDAGSIAGSFLTNQPKYDVQSNALFLYPIPQQNVTAGLKIWFYRGLNEFVSTDTTKVFGFDDLWHPMACVHAAMEYAVLNDLSRAGNLKGMWDDWEARFRKFKKQEDRNYMLKPAFVDYS